MRLACASHHCWLMLVANAGSKKSDKLCSCPNRYNNALRSLLTPNACLVTPPHQPATLTSLARCAHRYSLTLTLLAARGYHSCFHECPLSLRPTPAHKLAPNPSYCRAVLRVRETDSAGQPNFCASYCLLLRALPFELPSSWQADPIAAALAANAAAVDAAATTATNLDQAALTAIPQRVAVYVAREESAGAFTYTELDTLTTELCKTAPHINGTEPTATCKFLANSDKSHATVALVETFSEAVALDLIARAPGARLLACLVQEAATVPKIASAVEGNTVLHIPLPDGDFDYTDGDAITRHATAWLVSFGVCMSTVSQDGHTYPIGGFALVAASVTPRMPNSSVITGQTFPVGRVRGMSC